MNGSLSLLWRGIVAIALMIGFYVLSVAVAAVLLGIPYAELRYSRTLHPKIDLFCIVTAIIILWSIVPRADRFKAPGPALNPTEHPRLFGQLKEIARAAMQPVPREVYLLPEVNAWVAQRGGVMGIGSRRVMGIGLPLMAVLNVGQFRAVLAHEFGHFAGCDTKLGPWIYKTRSTIGRTIQSLAEQNSVIAKPFIWYGNAFLRVTQAISRQQEITADRFAAQLAGGQQLIDGLLTTHRAAPAFDQFLEREVSPVLEAGFHAPLLEGFETYLAAPRVASDLQQALDEELASPQADAFDSHPPLKERIEALSRSQGPREVSQGVRATHLLADLEDAEQSLLLFSLGSQDYAKLSPLSWKEVGPKVLIPMWRAASSHASFLKGITPLRLPETAKRLESAIQSWATRAASKDRRTPSRQDEGPTVLGLSSASDYDEIRDQLERLRAVGSALMICLFEQGWTLHAEPGEGFLEKDGTKIEPFAILDEMAEEQFDVAAWTEFCKKCGIADLDLGSAAGKSNDNSAAAA